MIVIRMTQGDILIQKLWGFFLFINKHTSNMQLTHTRCVVVNHRQILHAKYTSYTYMDLAVFCCGIPITTHRLCVIQPIIYYSDIQLNAYRTKYLPYTYLFLFACTFLLALPISKLLRRRTNPVCIYTVFTHYILSITGKQLQFSQQYPVSVSVTWSQGVLWSGSNM